MEYKLNTTEQTFSGPDVAEPGLNVVGAILREAREQNGLSVEDIAGRLKFSPRQIIALEDGDIAQLPQLAFIRGFVRSYARVLQLDEASLLAALPGDSTPMKTVLEKQAETVPSRTMQAKQANILWLVGALVVTGMLGLFALYHEEQAPVDTAPQEVAVQPNPADIDTASSPVGAPVSTLPESGVHADEKRIAVSAKAVASPELHVPAKPPVIKPHPAEVQAASAVGGGVVRVHRPNAILRMTFDQDSWVEVKDGEGKSRTSYLYLKGSEQSLDGAPPLSVVIGNTNGVKLYFRGEPVDLAPYTYQGVARLKLE